MEGNKNTCSYCKFCGHDAELNSYACHNEDGEFFGTCFSVNEIQRQTCKKWTPYSYDLTLKEALRRNTSPSCVSGIMYNYRLPEKGSDGYACATILFDTNEQLVDWATAHTCLFGEYMKIAEKDGDFKDPTEP